MAGALSENAPRPISVVAVSGATIDNARSNQLNRSQGYNNETNEGNEQCEDATNSIITKARSTSTITHRLTSKSTFIFNQRAAIISMSIIDEIELLEVTTR
ncbi:hypothetical protein APICC_08420 [Apis cerana cerana]|uniref:Uncharacterized protein n=1 Tax=Apis cerana cerana TaxID=94128 RepID=A0A2A3E2X7_APICC|nr:hypothetical protein APICC_08420 [Apis cerana cerana]